MKPKKKPRKKKRKPTLTERIIAARAKHDTVVEAAAKAAEAADQKALDFLYSDAEITLAALQRGLPFQKRLEMLRGMKAWPRIVLGLYKAEREIAEQRKKKHPPLKGSADDVEPSEAAYAVVAELINVGENRVKALCQEGRRDIDAGAPRQPKMSAAEFKKCWRDLP